MELYGPPPSQSPPLSSTPLHNSLLQAKKENFLVRILLKFFLEFWVLLRRSVWNLYRDRSAMLAGLLEAIVVGAMIGMVFFQVKEDLLGAQSRAALFFIICSLQSYILLTYNTYRCMYLSTPIFVSYLYMHSVPRIAGVRSRKTR